MGGSPPADPVTWEAFGGALLDSEDLDPVYVALWGADLDPGQRARWLLAYWMFYATGPASDLSEESGDRFWAAVRDGFDERPRGFERRHFRGDRAREAVAWLSRRDPEAIVGWLVGRSGARRRIPYQEVADRVQTLPMFGPWIAWKACDMLERCCGVPVAFDPRALAMYRDPVQGAALLLRGDWRAPITDEEVTAVARRVTAAFEARSAPPRYDRAFNVQEAETVLCKYKAYVKGFYHVGKDVHDVRESLTAARSETAARLLAASPEEVGQCVS